MSRDVRLLHFHKAGHGHEEEYVVLVEAGDHTPHQDHTVPGYVLVSETEIETTSGQEMPFSLPYSETLRKR